MKKLTMEYSSRIEFKLDEDMRLKGIAFDRLDEYLRKIIKDDGAAGVLAGLDIKRKPKSAEELVYKLTEHFRQRLNSVYQEALDE